MECTVRRYSFTCSSSSDALPLSGSHTCPPHRVWSSPDTQLLCVCECVCVCDSVCVCTSPALSTHLCVFPLVSPLCLGNRHHTEISHITLWCPLTSLCRCVCVCVCVCTLVCLVCSPLSVGQSVPHSGCHTLTVSVTVSSVRGL